MNSQQQPVTDTKIMLKQWQNKAEIQQIQEDTMKFKWDPNDMKIKKYFNSQQTILPILYFDIDSSKNISLKLENENILFYDKKENDLKILSTNKIQQQKKNDKEKRLSKNVLNQKNLTDILQQVELIPQIQSTTIQKFTRQTLKMFHQVDLNTSFQEEDLHIDTQEDLIEQIEQQQEEVTRMELSYDEKQIIIGTSKGKIFSVCLEDLSPKDVFMIDHNNAVTDLVIKENIMVFAFKNGHIEIIKRPNSKESFKKCKLKSEDKIPIIGLKISQNNEQLVAIQAPFKKISKVIVYDLKDNKENGRVSIFTNTDEGNE